MCGDPSPVSAMSSVVTAAKDSLKNGQLDERRFMAALGCDPDNLRLQRLVQDFAITCRALHNAACDDSLPHPVTNRKRQRETT